MTAWLIETLAASTLLMLLVLLVRGKMAAWFGASAAYLLWLMPALRMILPPLPHLWPAPAIVHLPIGLAAPVHAPIVPMAALPAVPVETAGFPFGEALLALWLAGAGTLLLWSLLMHRRFVRGLLATARPVPALNRLRGIAVVASSSIGGPLATGLWKRMIVLPADYADRYVPAELALVMCHETVHHRRGDLYWNLAALVMLSLHWFNPVAWRAYRAFRADQELACDARVLFGRDAGERHAYGTAVVKSASDRSPVAACTFHRKDQLKGRLKMMGRMARSRGMRASGTALVALLMGAGLFLTASGGMAAVPAPSPAPHPAAQPAPPAVPAPVARPAPPAVPAPQARLHADDADVPDVSIPDVGAIVERSVAEAMTKLNQAMASSEKGRAAAAGVRTGFAKCAAEGGDRNAVLKRCYGVDMEQIHNQVLSGLEEARNELKASEDLSQAQRDKAVRSLERAIARLKNDPHWAK